MGRPKALIVWRGRPFVSYAVDLACAASCDPIVVVDGAQPLPPEVLGGARLVHNAAWQSGPLSSLQMGLREVLADPEVETVLVLTVDRPHLASSTVTALVEAGRVRRDEIWQPRFAGRRGHPIVYPREVASALSKLPLTDTPRRLLRATPWNARRRSLEVDDPAVLDNLDTPADLVRCGITE
jgi:CTP:molybdopterin cytidylyltransferase MocA